MNYNNLGTVVMGIKCPIIREGDNLEDIVFNSVVSSQNGIIYDKDVIGITESVVARAQGNYVTVDDIANEVTRIFGENPNVSVINPIYSRNRFSLILKGIARAAQKVVIVMPRFDEVGNPRDKHPFTHINYINLYTEICESENAKCYIVSDIDTLSKIDSFEENYNNAIIASIHNRTDDYEKIHGKIKVDLTDFFKEKTVWGLLGSNKASEERLKLFPNTILGQELVNSLQKRFKDELGKDVDVMIYGDGAFKSPYANGTSVWELADPVTTPCFTKGLAGCPNEVKIKNLADDKFSNLSGNELDNAIKNEIATSNQAEGAMGTTPRQYVDLLASLMDLTSGSGEKGTPVVLVRNYFNNYSS